MVLMKRRIKTIFIFLIALLLASWPAHADHTMKFCFNSWEPFTYLDKKGKPQGISIDIVRHVAQEMNQVIELNHLPWKRCLQQVQSGKIDAVIDAAKRDAFLQGPTSVGLFSNTVWVHQGDPLRFLKSYADLKGRKVGFVDGYKYPKDFTDIEDLKIDYSLDDLTALRKLSAKRVDFVVADITNTYAAIKNFNLNIKPLRPTPSADKLYISFNKNKTALQKEFDRTLLKLLNEGQVDAIYQKHIQQTFSDIVKSIQPMHKGIQE